MRLSFLFFLEHIHSFSTYNQVYTISTALSQEKKCVSDGDHKIKFMWISTTTTKKNHRIEGGLWEYYSKMCLNEKNYKDGDKNNKITI